jgi:integrase
MWAWKSKPHSCPIKKRPARKLPLRSALVNMLRQLPRTGELVFPIGVHGLPKAWGRICKEAHLTEEDKMRIHDLRHEAI